MADVTLTYKGQNILELNESSEEIIKTAGKYCEDDISLSYVKSSGGGVVIPDLPDLPDDYKELLYLITNSDNGNPYITIQTVANLNSHTIVEFLGDGIILGSRISSIWNFNIATSNKTYTPYNVGIDYVSWDVINQDVNTWSSFSISMSSTNFNYGRWDSSYLYEGNLGKLIMASYLYSGNSYNSIYLNSMEINLALIPCYRKSDDVNGFYDVISNTFYTAITGTFTRGPEK